MRLFFIAILLHATSSDAMFIIKNHLYEDIQIQYSFENVYPSITSIVEAHSSLIFTFYMPREIWIKKCFSTTNSKNDDAYYYIESLPADIPFLHIIRNRAFKAGLCAIMSMVGIKDVRAHIPKNKQSFERDPEGRIGQIEEEKNETDEN